MSQGGKQAFEKKIADLEALRSTADLTVSLPPLRKALKDRSNYLVSKGAAIAGDLRREELIPDLIAAFDRFRKDPVKSDPQCWAKTAIAKALKDLGHRNADIFLTGIVHVQMEPVWGGRADSAATLRGTCALALVDCQLDDLEILTHLADRLADPEKPVRVDAALAIGQFGRTEGVPLLRLKALLGDREPEVTGQCFVSLMSLVPRESLAFISSFLQRDDDEVCAEAASALALSREPEAIEILRGFWSRPVRGDVRRAILISLGGSALREAAELLLEMLSKESGEIAAQALNSLATSRFHEEMRGQIRDALGSKQDAELDRMFAKLF